MPSLATPKMPIPRYQKVVAFFIILWLVLFGLFDLNWHYAPWENQFRDRGMAVMREEIIALPSVDGVQPLSSQESQENPLISLQYPRTAGCAEVFAHYRQAAEARGWNYAWTDKTAQEDHFTGLRQGYHLALVIDCQSTPAVPSEARGQPSYELGIEVPFPYNISFFSK